MRTILLSILFVFLSLASGCQSNSASSDVRAFLDQCKKEEQAHKDMMAEIDRKADEYMENFKKEHADYYATLDRYSKWYSSLSVDQKEFIDKELEEKQIRYNMIHGFNRDGSSGYVGSGRSLSDGIVLMYKYKDAWDKIDY